jgi:hypothetical protein
MAYLQVRRARQDERAVGRRVDDLQDLAHHGLVLRVSSGC